MKKKLTYLNIIRIVAILIILLFHFSKICINNNIQGFFTLNLFANGDWGYIGVAIFFMLSGFSLMYNYNKEKELKIKEFYKKRFFSIYPLFWISYIIALVYYIIRGQFIIKGSMFRIISCGLCTVLGLDGYLGNITSKFSDFYILGEWFLGCIIAIYCLFPLLRKLAIKYNLRFFIISTIVYVIIAIFDPLKLILIHRNIIVCMYQFIIGMYLVNYIDKINYKHAIISIVGIIVILSVKLILPETISVTIISILFFILLKFIGEKVTNIKMEKILSIFSKYSYGAYLVHHVIMNEVIKHYSNITINNLQAIGLFLICFIIIAIFTTIISYIYEMIKKILKKEKKTWERT